MEKVLPSKMEIFGC